jgi:hypothetical protein
MLLPDNRIRIGGNRPAKMVDKMRVAIGSALSLQRRESLSGPAQPRTAEPAAGSRRAASAQAAKAATSNPAGIKNGMQELASQQPADGF